jgi:hypothetical protein
MKKYKAIASYTTYVQAYIEAETEDEAYAIAKEMDGGSFKQMDEGHRWWQINSVLEVKE